MMQLILKKAAKQKPKGATHFHSFGDNFTFYCWRDGRCWQYHEDGIWRIRTIIIKTPMFLLP